MRIHLNKVIFLRFYNELKFHILSRDGKMLGLSPCMKISILSKSEQHSTVVLSTINIVVLSPAFLTMFATMLYYGKMSMIRWYGHVQRATSCINSITRLGLPGTRDRGRSRKTWSACVRNDMTICNLDGVNPLDRNSWRTSVRCCLPRSPGQPQHLKYQNRI